MWGEGERERIRHTADDDILGAVHDLRAAVGVEDGQVARVQDAAEEQLPRRLRVPVVAPGADVAEEDDLAELPAVPGHVDEHAAAAAAIPVAPAASGMLLLLLLLLLLVVVAGRPHDADRQARHEPVALPRHPRVPLRRRQRLPRGELVALGDGAVRLRHAVDVHGVEV